MLSFEPDANQRTRKKFRDDAFGGTFNGLRRSFHWNTFIDSNKASLKGPHGLKPALLKFSWPGQDPGPVVGDRDHMFEMGRVRPVFRNRRPLIRQDLRIRLSGIHHRLDR